MTLPEDQPEAPRPSFLGIHSRDNDTQILYISSGCREAMGFTPAQMMANQAKGYIYDSFNTEYPTIYQDKAKDSEFEDEGNDDESNAFCIYMNLHTATGPPILHRGAPVQAGRAPLYFSRSRQIKAVLVLEHPEAVEIDTEETGRRPTGPLIAFCTSSISRLVDVDNSDIMNYPFMKLVAPEDLVHVFLYFERLSKSSEVLFETFSLLQRPNVIEGDIFVSDEENQRVVVEALGANVQDGIAILIRRLKVIPAPKRDTMGRYIHSRMREMTEDNGYQSLCEFISSDANTSEAEGWSQLR
ncbi:hypothetical protein GGH96_003146 [Coemansia sp. RSA 1972]|nr:hypothetical protein GGH96_003146 [Coemansia sp. RSA 1972]